VDDLEKVGACTPGVESIAVGEDGRFVARARIGFGPIGFTFSIDGQIVDRVVGERATMRGWARAPGTEVDGTSRMILRDAGSGATVMAWSTEVRFSGRIAAIGARLVQGTANRMIAQLFRCIKAKLEIPA
jgi:carbon monoxide dehydrogenase subunit G